MRNAEDPYSSATPVLGVFCAVVMVFLLIFAAERSGLPVQWSEWFVQTIVFMMFLSAIWFGRSAAERIFFGYAPATEGNRGGIVLGFIVFGVSRLLPGANQAELWLPTCLGMLIGVVIAHLLYRWHFKRNNSAEFQSIGITDLDVKTPMKRFLLGSALCLFGLFIALPSLANALATISPALSGTASMALSYILILATLAIVLGGAHGAVTMALILMLLTSGGIFLTLTIGLAASSTLPLPWFDNPATLRAVIDLKGSLGLAETLIFQNWPSINSMLTLDGMTAFILATMSSAAITLTLAPTLQIARRNVATATYFTLVILPLLLIAFSGYAIEAAAEQFLGSAINNPPAALLEASRLGLVKVCGAYPETVDALRQQCGVAPRDTTQIDISRLQLQPAFVFGGLPVSLGYTSIISQIARIFPFAISLATIGIGIWFMALGLSRYILGQYQNKPGLASHRIALTRMSALLSAVTLLMFLQFSLTLSPNYNAILGGASAAIIAFVHFGAVFSSSRTPRQTPQAA